MALLLSFGTSETEPTLRGQGFYLRPPLMADFPQWSVLREESRSFLSPWEPLWPVDDLTKPAFRRRLRRYANDRKEGRSYPFFLFSQDGTLLGGATLSNIRRGVAQCCSLGYWMGARHAGKGHMSRAVALIAPFCFDVLRLHRIEAACLPSNGPSIQLLRKNGFTREGYARRYLNINGQWQDHLLFARLADDPVPAVTAASPQWTSGASKEIL
ncbi:GNAT family protein [Pannonibacter sp. Pt2]|uniref:GNAT family protein n=1 Tax=Pannonibacter anstelovis TaxID=3121537 RepID=A0ABU7ZJF7_9HYPH